MANRDNDIDICYHGFFAVIIYLFLCRILNFLIIYDIIFWGDFISGKIPRRVLQNNIEISKRQMLSYFEMHSHDYFEIELITSGTGTQLLNGTEYKLYKGYVSLMTNTDFHGIVYADNVETYNISFSENCISEHITDSIMNTDFKETGTSPMSYLAKLRLDYAQKMLLSTKLTVTEICFASGFTSLSNFLKAFKNRFGVSPSGMRCM